MNEGSPSYIELDDHILCVVAWVDSNDCGESKLVLESDSKLTWKTKCFKFHALKNTASQDVKRCQIQLKQLQIKLEVETRRLTRNLANE